MFDLRPVGYVTGLLVAFLGVTMLLPMLVDIVEGQGHWMAFLESAIISIMTGGLVALVCSNGVRQGLSIRQTFLLTTGVWVALPVFGAHHLLLNYADTVLSVIQQSNSDRRRSTSNLSNILEFVSDHLLVNRFLNKLVLLLR